MTKMANIIYQNNLRTEAEHIASGEKFFTDAPIDNKGKGQAFSPTDLVAIALGSCMITIMAIAAEKYGIDVSGIDASVEKIMDSKPRRIKEIIIRIGINKDIEKKDRNHLENAALACPVSKSLHPDLVKKIRFIYS